MPVIIYQVCALFVFMNLWFIFAIYKKRNDVADIAWGLGFVLLALIGVYFNPTIRTILITVLVLCWGLRLAIHIGTRFLKTKEEDNRYKKMRESWSGSQTFNSWLRIFILQGTLLLLVSSSILVVSNFDTGDINTVNFIGLAIWLFGFIFEIVGDKQLKQFISKAENKGKIMKSGLWKYTRHPNYFGEATLWWGLCLMTWGTDYFWLGLIGPITITILLRYVSGLPLAESRYKDNPEFIEYAKNTPAIVPNFLIK